MSWLSGKRITVTGGAGFLGTQVVSKLRESGCQEIFVPRSKDYDLTDNEDVKHLYQNSRPDILVHLAARMGGIGINQEKPGELFYNNVIMGLQTMEQGKVFGLEKFVAVGTVCSYPKNISIPSTEEFLWDGYPEETNAPYGLAKKMAVVQAQSYRKQYGYNAINLLLVNLYGPGDNFNLKSSHVVPALIKKCLDAIDENKGEIIVWGSGKPTREYLYVEDAAEGIVLATQQYNKPTPVNLGSGFEISIKDLARLIARTTGFKGRIVWDRSKPDGQPRRLFDSSKAEREFGFKARTDFQEGLRKTIQWYREQRTKGLVA